VDLFYAGGIGTFVKSTQERDTDVGDRANDAVRIDADVLGARVVVEGGNLAITQRGRVQYARRGGRINADFVDNAAGVDTSDHEVNLKILLALAEADGDLSPQGRDVLLAEVADDVAAEVLRDVALQTALLSRELTHGPGRMEAYEALMSRLETAPAAGRLSRTAEALPTTDELRRRTRAGAGLTRPELAVLMAHAKIDLAGQLTGADLPGSGAQTWRAVLCGYHPARIAERYCALLHDPRLRADLVRALVATVVANDVVNRMGITYADRTAREHGATLAEVAAAFWTARQVAGAEALWTAAEALDGQLDPQVQHELPADIDLLLDAFTRWYLRQDPPDIDAVIAEDRRAFLTLQALPSPTRPARAAQKRARVDRYRSAGVDADLARRVAALQDLAAAPDIAAVARQSRRSVREVGGVFAAIDEVLPLEPVADVVRALAPRDSWEWWQRHGLLDDLGALRRQAARAATAAGARTAAQAVALLQRQRAVARRRALTVVDRLAQDPHPGPAAAAVAVRALRDTVGEDAWQPDTERGGPA
jgi:glutamate dehydrogenase